MGRGARSQEVLGGQADPPLALGMSSWYTSNIEIRASGDKCQCDGFSGFHVGFPWITGRPVSEVLLRTVHRMDSGDPLPSPLDSLCIHAPPERGRDPGADVMSQRRLRRVPGCSG